MKIKLIIISLLFFSSILKSQNTINEIEKNINNRNKDLNELKNEIKKIENEINSKIEEEVYTQEIITQINEKIKLTEKLIEELNKEENYLSNLIYKNENNIKIKEDELKILQNQLKNRVIYLYKYGREGTLSSMINNENWNKIIYRTKYLQVLNQSEDKIKKRINETIQSLRLEKTALQKEKERKSFLISEKDKEFFKLENDKKSKQEYIKKIKKQKKQLSSDLQQKKDMMSQVEKIINKLFSDKKELKKRQEELIKLRTKQNKSTSGNFAKMKRKLPWPVDGNIIGKFGIQKNTKLNTQYENIGVDIKTKKSANVISVLDGVISSITTIKGYGNVVILDHGAGYYSVYSNLENISVSEGDYIPDLFQIGTVAKNNSSHYDSNYIFHFQIWGNKEKLNPEDWLIKK